MAFREEIAYRTEQRGAVVVAVAAAVADEDGGEWQ